MAEQNKVCILAAGKHQIGEERLVNPAILPVNQKAVISYIIEKFSEDTEIVIAVGYKKETLKEYLQLAHPNNRFTFVEIEQWEGPGTGPGTSLLACKDHLQSPFVLFTADTILVEEVPPPTYNWVGVAHVTRTEPYATVKIEEDFITDWVDKERTEYHHAYVGTAGIKDYETFWAALEKDKTERAGEVQITNGIIPWIADKKLRAKFFTWFDTGSPENMERTLKEFNDEEFDFGKMDEFIYFVNGRVIKYYEKQDIVTKKLKRASSSLKDVVPNIVAHTPNFFAYEFVKGSTLYPKLNDSVCAELLDWAQTYVWKPVKDADVHMFRQAMKEFYQAKTQSRLAMFYDRTGIRDMDTFINDEPVEKLSALMDKIDWEWLCNGTPVVFHGDCNFGNLVITNAEMGSRHRFYVIDWRQEMAGLTEYGDVYYDLAKLYGGMIIHFELIRQNQFSYRNESGRVYLDFKLTNSVVSARDVFERFVQQRGYDLKKIKVLTALTFLNMAPLHHDPYNRMLYYFGRLQLKKALEHGDPEQ